MNDSLCILTLILVGWTVREGKLNRRVTCARGGSDLRKKTHSSEVWIYKLFSCLGQGAVNLVDPPSGSLVANFEGAQNVSTLTCNVLNSNNARTITGWFLQDFRSSTGLTAIAVGEFTELFFIGGDVVLNTNITYRNQFTFLNFTSELDGVTVFCGTVINQRQANFTLRVYSKYQVHAHVLQYIL